MVRITPTFQLKIEEKKFLNIPQDEPWQETETIILFFNLLKVDLEKENKNITEVQLH